MIWVLVRKLLRDIWLAWIVVATLLFLFQILWARITMRVTTQILAAFERAGVSRDLIMQILLNQNANGQSNEFLGQMIQAIVGGENIELDKASDFMSVAYMHPLVLSILGIWAIGRAANAIAGEIDRGTMELLLAQPIRRLQIISAHLVVDVVVFPTLALAMWVGTYFGTLWMGLQDSDTPRQHVDPLIYLPALMCVWMLLFAVSGVTMAISSLVRGRGYVWGTAVTLFLLMFFINIFGQMWPEVLEPLRPITVHYHYQPQVMIQNPLWYKLGSVWGHLAYLGGVGAAGYGFAAWWFCRRDLPAPL
ncbi:MAG TPA: ABC transporter permease subunit [Gemmataceae bacterium]|nr:ABC transporter permease subunit [Gemmataceae bacterium]